MLNMFKQFVIIRNLRSLRYVGFFVKLGLLNCDGRCSYMHISLDRNDTEILVYFNLVMYGGRFGNNQDS